MSTEAEFDLSYNQLPTRSSYDQTADLTNQTPTLTVSGTNGGSYYVYLHGREGAALPQAFTLSAAALGLTITSYTPTFTPLSTQPVQFQINGTSFTPATTVAIQMTGQAAIAPLSQKLVNGTILAQFDLSSVTPGIYTLSVNDGQTTAVGSSQLQIASSTFDPNATARIVGTTATNIRVVP